jgi:hypothetical protein
MYINILVSIAVWCVGILQTDIHVTVIETCYDVYVILSYV